MRSLQVVEAGVVNFAQADSWQRSLYERRLSAEIPDVLLLLQHPHVYSLGRRFDQKHLLFTKKEMSEKGISVHEADRGGSITYHGPGQLVGYPILDLRKLKADGLPDEADQPDVVHYVRVLEEAIIKTVNGFGVIAVRREGLTGVWVGESKLASIGVNVTRGVTRHGIAINVAPDLSFFEGIVACGIEDVKVTSLQDLLGLHIGVEEVGRHFAENLAPFLRRRVAKASLEDLGLSLSESVADVVSFKRDEKAV